MPYLEHHLTLPGAHIQHHLYRHHPPQQQNHLLSEILAVQGDWIGAWEVKLWTQSWTVFGKGMYHYCAGMERNLVTETFPSWELKQMNQRQKGNLTRDWFLNLVKEQNTAPAQF